VIDKLDLVLKRTLLSGVPVPAAQLSFQPPNQDWQQRVASGIGLWLNCALVDLREDRHRRSTETRIEPDTLRRIRAPFLMRCHFLISAWSSAKDGAGTNGAQIDATGGEHALLGSAVSTLLENAPLTPSQILVPADLATLPESWREASFDTDVLPPEGFPKLAEFWGNQGRAAGWRPSVWLVVTVPVTPSPIQLGGIVTHIVTGLGAETFTEAVTDLGGLVLDATGAHAAAPVPLMDALVTVTNTAGQLCARDITAADGHFVLTGLPPGDYRISARSAAHAPLAPEPITVPWTAPGPLELQFT
jgi:Pvc16 N-terminal domain/Carboxypeptidase regulatory-like domain